MWCMWNTSSKDLRGWASAAQDTLSFTISRQHSIHTRLHIWATGCCRRIHLCSLDIPGGTATWRWCLRCDCNQSSDRCHHPTAWLGRSGSCWCPGATLPCGELALPFPVQGGPHGRGWHDSLLSVFQMAPRTMHHRRVRHEGHTVVDLHTMSLPTFSHVCPQCDIGSNAGEHVTNIGD